MMRSRKLSPRFVVVVFAARAAEIPRDVPRIRSFYGKSDSELEEADGFAKAPSEPANIEQVGAAAAATASGNELFVNQQVGPILDHGREVTSEVFFEFGASVTLQRRFRIGRSVRSPTEYFSFMVKISTTGSEHCA